MRSPCGAAVLYCSKYGSKWQSRLDLGIFIFQAGFGNRSYWGTFEHVFSDTCNKGLESEIASFAGRKTGLIIPFGRQIAVQMGWSRGKPGIRDLFGKNGEKSGYFFDSSLLRM